MDQQAPRLYRSRTNRVIAGVCGGLGDYFHIDPTLIRIAFVAIAFGGGAGVLAYLIMMFVIPEQPADQVTTSVPTPPSSKVAGNGRLIVGLALILVGLMSFGNMFAWWFFRWNYFWPLIVVAIGVLILIRRR